MSSCDRCTLDARCRECVDQCVHVSRTHPSVVNVSTYENIMCSICLSMMAQSHCVCGINDADVVDNDESGEECANLLP